MFHLLATTILLIGDSHTVGPFGRKLDELLRTTGAQVATYASCGSVAGWFYNGKKTTCGYFERDLSGKVFEAKVYPTPSFPELVSRIRPDHIIIALGTNYVVMESDEAVKKDLSQMMEDIGDVKCSWILPPDMRKFRAEIPRLNRLMKEVAGSQCRFLESASMTHYPENGGDGIHYWSAEGTPLARAWANEVFSIVSGN